MTAPVYLCAPAYRHGALHDIGGIAALRADPDLLPGDSMVVTSQDLLDYRNSHLTSIEKRARSKP